MHKEPKSSRYTHAHKPEHQNVSAIASAVSAFMNRIHVFPLLLSSSPPLRLSFFLHPPYSHALQAKVAELTATVAQIGNNAKLNQGPFIQGHQVTL